MAALIAPNALTKGAITTLSPKNAEEKWRDYIFLGIANRNSFADNMIGGPNSGKVFENYSETARVDGNTLHILNLAQFGAPVIQGDTERAGNEEPFKPGDFSLTWGMRWHGSSRTRVAETETKIGSQWDMEFTTLSKNRLGKQVNDDMMIALREGATGYNTVYADGLTLDTLKSANTIGTGLITKAAVRASSIGCRPVKLAKSNAGPDIEQFVFYGTHENLLPLEGDPSYYQSGLQADVRGDANMLFTGDYQPWRGHIIYRDYVRRHDGYGSVGNTLQPDAYVGTAIPGSATAGGAGATDTFTTLTGGGNSTAAAVTPLRQFFEFFSLYAYTMPDGSTKTRNSGTRYALIIDASTNKVSFVSFTANNGNTLTISKRLGSVASVNYATTIGNVTWNTGAFTTASGTNYAGVTEGAIASGSRIVEANANGVPIGYSLMLGRRAGVFGWGKTGNGLAGKRTVWVTDSERVTTLGAEIAYGVREYVNTDGNPDGFVLLIHARDVDGAPNVT